MTGLAGPLALFLLLNLLVALIRAALVDVALVLALLAAITGVAFARRAWGRDGREHEHGD